MIKLGEKFDKSCSKIKWNSCQSCQRSFPGLVIKNDKCSSCNNILTKELFTQENNMDPGEIPEELQNLTDIEQLLIAQVHPIISLWKIRGAQYAYSGNVINFRQDVNEYITKLPIDPSTLPSTIIFYKDTKFGLANFRVRSKKILDALIWLKNNNIYYHNITINYSVLNKLPSDGNIQSMLPNVNASEINEENYHQYNAELEENYVPLFEHINQQERIFNELRLPYPSLIYM